MCGLGLVVHLKNKRVLLCLRFMMMILACFVFLGVRLYPNKDFVIKVLSGVAKKNHSLPELWDVISHGDADSILGGPSLWCNK